MEKTIIQDLGPWKGNHLWIKREDFIPFSFGGNKARKAELFFQEINSGGYDCVVTYGGWTSNHCRIVANHCAKSGLECHIISPEETAEESFNQQMMQLFGARGQTVPVQQVHDTIEKKLDELRSAGKNPYFIPGGGHGDLGTEAYVQCFREITGQERELGVFFHYIFFASGTGTTQAGLVCGQLLQDHEDIQDGLTRHRSACTSDMKDEKTAFTDAKKKDERQIIGISIARKNPAGRDVVLDSIRSYLNSSGKHQVREEEIQARTIFIDEYTSGYGRDRERVLETIKEVLIAQGIPLDATYTGKAFDGMSRYLDSRQIRDRNILFIHTGGTPLFFDVLKKMQV